jgi:hypothetical protein
MQGIEAASMKMAAQMFWIMWTTDVMPAKVVIEEM